MAQGTAAELRGLREVLFGGNPERIARVEEYEEQLTLAQDLLAMRDAAGLYIGGDLAAAGLVV